ncbi:AAA family ATPase [Halorarum salinum]|uniref:MoxR family ATPase n=1 Tax=Halorarum salinum TaxID=2743089 RepID=A0A7D5QD61_9EURY|nr:MoxR family ATPase [Halobaculum salinum]QLG63599.1 MoxR family ATPase [Halobaculum salinum]
MNAQDVETRCRAIVDELSRTVIVDDEVLRTVLTGLLAGGHVMLEDVPGTGKTLTARTLADALGLSFSRVQFTPDLLPSDVTGTDVFDEGSREFEFRPGPLFANVVLADEINRASPKTQSALLEAMEEEQVTVGGETHPLPTPFFVVATGNPVESEGTFELPAAQRDRFMLETSIGYPDMDGELELIDRRASRRATRPSTEQVCTAGEVEELREAPEDVHVEPPVRRYVASVTRATREDDRVATGVSPRGTERLFEAARARAAIGGREYVSPDEVKDVAPAALAHRLILTAEARIEGVGKREVVDDVLSTVEVPKLSGAERR